MNPSFRSFSDEMVKIAIFRRLAKGFTSALSEGWHGTGPEGSATRNYWFGRGMENDLRPSNDPTQWGGKHIPHTPQQIAANQRALQANPAASLPYKYKPTAGTRAWEQLTSLGGLTKALPVGNKAMMAIPTAVMAAHALRGQDPTGQERSRTERISGLAANTVGGLAGSAMAMRALKGRGGFLGAMAAPMIGGMLGGSLAEKAVTAPFAAARAHRAGMAQPVYRQPLPPRGPQGFEVPPDGVSA